MILLQRGNENANQKILEDIDQVQGSQTWLAEVPTGLYTRCHHNGDSFVMEELGERGMSFLGFAQDYAHRTISGRDGLDIVQKWNDSFRNHNYSKEELDCLIKDGFLGVFAMIMPEIKEDETFKFVYEADKKVKELEEQFYDKPLSEVIDEVKKHTEDKDSEDYHLWNCIAKAYGDWMVLGTISPNRIEFRNRIAERMKETKLNTPSDNSDKSNTTTIDRDDDGR